MKRAKRKPQFRVGQIVMDKQAIPRKIVYRSGSFYQCIPGDGERIPNDEWQEKELRPLTKRERGQ
jgi:hypothetical protein